MNNEQSLTLRRFGYNTNQFSLVVLFLLGLASVLIIWLIMFDFELSALMQLKFMYFVALLVLQMAGFYLFYRWLKAIKVEINAQGISHTSGMPAWIERIYPQNWQVNWEEVQSIAFKKSPVFSNPSLNYFVIKTASKKYKITPLQWVDEKAIAEKKSLWQTLLYAQKSLEDRVNNDPLRKVFIAKGLLAENEAIVEKQPYTDLNSSPEALAVVVLFIISVIYAITEIYFTLSEFYVATPPFHWFAIVGLIGGVLVFAYLKQSVLKRYEMSVIAILAGLGFAMVSYPAFLRINQWTSSASPETYSYQLREKGRWLPANEQLPEVIFDLRGSDYWSQFEENTTKEFQLRKGGLGFYQINMAPIYAEQRAYYKAKRSN